VGEAEICHAQQLAQAKLELRRVGGELQLACLAERTDEAGVQHKGAQRVLCDADDPG